ncbi:hypothetical protein FHT40_001129 [Mycolicibacterium sp. BK556]|uniref:hypothetical protein n=1 Tax=unclassified Mycolicibacterium TaxID=2636767 RepID=UPI0017A10DD0|nr:hypothetical protein [Mycolicibacterium sp. BK556]MBB3631248.1 hypothetical protein [Mycolicibacterium sp. BK607]
MDTRAADIRVGRSPVAGTRVGRNPAAGTRAGRSQVAGSQAADSPAGDIRVADNPGPGTAVDQAIRAAVQVVQRAVPSLEHAPGVVAHEPILSTGGSFLNVLPIFGA